MTLAPSAHRCLLATLCIVGALALMTLAPWTVRAQDDAKAEATFELDASVLRFVDAFLASGDDLSDRGDEIWRTCIRRHGSIEPLLDELEARVDAEETAKEQRLPLIRLTVTLLRRLGEPARALALLDRIDVAEESVADCLAKAEVLDAMGRNDKALEAYDRLLGYPIDASLKNRILLRQALMRERKNKDEPSPLAVFAAGEGRDPSLRNQAAVVLALRDEQKDAIDLFQVSGEGTAVFRQETRLAEWAIEAEAWDKAQESAWRAVRAAQLKRDRRYALTILVEAYRRAKALDALTERFAEERMLDDESRQVWIDLLRETGKVDEALRLFRESTNGEFNIDMRRELLEMCRESGQEEVLINAYRELIEAEPRFIEWREGLSRFYLERGNRTEAEGIWRPYLEVTDDQRYRMAAAATLMGIGLDDLAIEFARSSMADADSRSTALLFLFELHFTRGRLEEAEAALVELDGVADPTAGVRKEMSEAYARLGNKARAVEILQGLREASGDKSNPDSDMKLALLLSEIGEEEQAMQLWHAIWRNVDSIPRRRYVEERLMTVASRLGELAKIAVELEEKLIDGKADSRDAGLLVRLYTRVNDPVSATEVIEEYMKKSGGKLLDALNEKARIFLTCTDYYNYEKVIEELIEIDPENRPDYLRQLAMSKLERGQRDKAREILEELKNEEADTASLEFEAGVLSLAGMREEALAAYWRSLAEHPERIDTYLLLSNIQKELDRHDRSAAMFQYTAATAEKDDLFTIAIDGILNMRDGRANRGAPDSLVEWARRVTLERVARRPDKLYLYQLVADLSDELKDKGMAIRALKAALPIAGEQRTQLLRELMTMAKPNTGRPGVIMVVSGRIVRGDEGAETPAEQLMFGRRLLGQGELVPPQVYLELGDAFLRAGEVVNATKTFNQASQLPEFAEMQRDIAAAFEKAKYPKESLRVYERILSVETTDVGLMAKVGELHEQLGNDPTSLELYERGIELLLARRPFTKTKKKEREDKPDPATNPMIIFGGNRNVDEYDTHYDWVLKGLLATLPDGEQLERLLTEQRRKIADEIRRVTDREREEEEILDQYPRLEARAALYRRLAVAYSRFDLADELDRELLELFPKDEKLLEQFCRYRLRWGYVVSARRLIDGSSRPEKEKRRLRLYVGGDGGEEIPGVIAIAEATNLFLPLLVSGRDAEAKTLLERLDLSTGEKSDLEHMSLLIATAAYLKESEIALGLCRHWLNLHVRHSSGALYGAVEGLLKQSRIVLDTKQQRSLVEQLVNTVIEKPDKFSSFIQRLPELQKNFGSNLMTTEQVEKLIESRLEASDRFIYGIPELFALIPAEDRASVLRASWSKVQKSQRAMFLLQLMPKLDTAVEETFADFLVTSFKESMNDVGDAMMLTYYVDQMVDGGAANMAVVTRFIEILREDNDKEPTYQVAQAICLHKQGRKDEAFAVAREAFSGLATASKDDYRVTSAISRITMTFHEDYFDELMTAIEELEAKKGESPELTARRLDLVAFKDDNELLLDELKTAVKKHPKDVGLHTRLRRHYDLMGYRVEAIETQARLVEIEPKKKKHRDRLVGDWRRMLNPIEALRVRDEKKKEAEDTASEKKEKTPPASIAGVKKAIDDGKLEDARLMFRRVWRVFPDRSDQFYRYNLDYSMGRRQLWPLDPKKPKEKAKPSRGGLPDFAKIRENMEKRQVNNDERRSAQEALTEYEFGEQEVRRQLRSLDARHLANEIATDSYKAMSMLQSKAQGREQAIAELLELERAGRAGKIEYGMLFALLEEAPEEGGGDIAQTLGGLIKNVNPKDTGQLRRLARLYARTGSGKNASALYRWCATMQQEGVGFSYYNVASELLKEVIDNLEGEDRDLAVEAVLAYGDPGDDYLWGQDQYQRLVLETWDRLVGPEEALRRARNICEGVANPEQMPMRRAAMVATYLLARAGEHDGAVRCLEVALCKLPVPDELEYPYYRTYFENPGYMGYDDMFRIFPGDVTGWANPSEWAQLAADKIEEWDAADRMREDSAFQIVGLLAKRTVDAGRTDDARKLLARVEELAAGNPSRLLWAADLLRKLDDEPAADAIERQLLRERRLHVQRVPEVVARVRESEGAAEALALGEVAARYTLHEDLLDHLREAAETVGDAERTQHWTEMKSEMEAAKEALEEKRND